MSNRIANRFAVVVSLLFCFAMMPTYTVAQTIITAVCSIRKNNTDISIGRYTVDGCAQQIAAWGAQNHLPQAFGIWGGNDIKVDMYGYLYRRSNNAWQPVRLIVDSDGDKILYDACPSQRENYNNIFDTDGCPDTISDLINPAVVDINNFWSSFFQQYRLPYQAPFQILGYRGSRGQFKHSCTLEPGNAFYCPPDRSIYYDLNLIEQTLADRSLGDFAIVTILAHEWGHHIQMQLPRSNVPSIPMLREQQADCFAGAYGRYIADGNSSLFRLDEDDLREGARLLFNKGDDLPWNDLRSHGTPNQREAQYIYGFNGIQNCFP